MTRELFEERMRALRAELLGKVGALHEKAEADKAELLGKIGALYEKTEKDKAELLGRIEALYEKTEKDKAELLEKIEALRLAMDRKITLWSLVILFAVVLINRNALEWVGRLRGLVK